MPPRPHEPHEQLPGGRARNDTFSDNEFHKAKKAAENTTRSAKRWSFLLQDVPELLKKSLNDVNKGYTARVVAVLGATAGISYLLYRAVVVPTQERRPLAQRWSFISPLVPITLLERTREEGSSMYTLRFALPNSYDYAGYAPVSSVQMVSGRVHGLSSLRRWYTPISHPDERGFIEFAIKDCDPGRMSGRLRYLEPGDVVYLGRWMKEFHYKKDSGELGLVCTTAGASVALQLMNILDKDRADTTRLRVLYCHNTASRIPFKESYFDPYIKRSGGRISVSYNVLSAGKQAEKGSSGLVLGKDLFVGSIDPETLRKCLPPPVCMSTEAPPPPVAPTHPEAGTSEAGAQPAPGESADGGAYRPMILVCAPQSMLTYVCGRVSPIGNRTYLQGAFYRYSGFLKDMGYTRSQVYKFGVSTHFLAIR